MLWKAVLLLLLLLLLLISEGGCRIPSEVFSVDWRVNQRSQSLTQKRSARPPFDAGKKV